MNSWIKQIAIVALVGGMSIGAMGCGDDEHGQPQEGIAVAGEWETDFGDEESIDEEVWGFRDLIEYDNDERQAVTQNPEDAEWGPGEYSRIDWTPLEGDVFYYCESVHGLDSAQEAWEEEGEADAGDMDEGCGGFPWTRMERL